MEFNKIHGMRTFLLSIINLISEGEIIPCSFIVNNLNRGISTVLMEKYYETFIKCGFNPDYTATIDRYFQNWYSCADGKENKYCVKEKDGLLLLIALTLNDIL